MWWRLSAEFRAAVWPPAHDCVATFFHYILVHKISAKFFPSCWISVNKFNNLLRLNYIKADLYINSMSKFSFHRIKVFMRFFKKVILSPVINHILYYSIHTGWLNMKEKLWFDATLDIIKNGWKIKSFFCSPCQGELLKLSLCSYWCLSKIIY